MKTVYLDFLTYFFIGKYSRKICDFLTLIFITEVLKKCDNKLTVFKVSIVFFLILASILLRKINDYDMVETVRL